MSLGLRLLGQLEVLRDGKALPLPPSKKTRALLAYLAATHEPHSRAQLCELQWEGPDDPRAALRWSLTKIRQILDDEDATRLVTDHERASLSSVPNQTATSSDGNSMRVAFPLPTISGGIQPYSAVTCNPASGALFPVGTTTDTCVVSDSESPPVTVLSTFSVTVTVVTGSLTVTWDANVPSDNVTDYQIVYGTVTGQYLASLDTGLSTTGTLTGLTKGVTYYVVVRAFNGLWSGNSNEVSRTP